MPPTVLVFSALITVSLPQQSVPAVDHVLSKPPESNEQLSPTKENTTEKPWYLSYLQSNQPQKQQ